MPKAVAALLLVALLGASTVALANWDNYRAYHRRAGPILDEYPRLQDEVAFHRRQGAALQAESENLRGQVRAHRAAALALTPAAASRAAIQAILDRDTELLALHLDPNLLQGARDFLAGLAARPLDRARVQEVRSAGQSRYLVRVNYYVDLPPGPEPVSAAGEWWLTTAPRPEGGHWVVRWDSGRPPVRAARLPEERLPPASEDRERLLGSALAVLNDALRLLGDGDADLAARLMHPELLAVWPAADFSRLARFGARVVESNLARLDSGHDRMTLSVRWQLEHRPAPELDWILPHGRPEAAAALPAWALAPAPGAIPEPLWALFAPGEHGRYVTFVRSGGRDGGWRIQGIGAEPPP